jgi:hypothetical protein
VLQPEIVRSAVANGVDDAGAVVPEDNRIIAEERIVFGWRLLETRNREDWLKSSGASASFSLASRGGWVMMAASLPSGEKPARLKAG